MSKDAKQLTQNQEKLAIHIAIVLLRIRKAWVQVMIRLIGLLPLKVKRLLLCPLLILSISYCLKLIFTASSEPALPERKPLKFRQNLAGDSLRILERIYKQK